MSIFTRHLWILLATSFVLFSWPFAYFPITDGDINNWSDAAFKFTQTWDWFQGENDQSHGPLLIWTAAIAIKFFGPSLYALNLFNVLVSVLGCFFLYYFSFRFWNNRVVSSLTCFFYVSCLGSVYLARTPMYDWPAAISFFGFCGFYTLYCDKKRWTHLFLAFLCISIGSLSRFSICLGLAGIFICLMTVIYRRSFWLCVRDGLFLILAIVLINLPWFMGQVSVSSLDFVKEFIYDNTGRYVKSTRPGATIRFDFYGLPLYTLIGLIPYTFLFVGSFFRKKVVSIFKENHYYLVIAAGFLPALVLFSFSGHTKLARYIAYVFPFLFMLMAHRFVMVDALDEFFKKRCKKMILWVTSFLTLLLVQQSIQFFYEVKQSLLFVLSVLVLVYGILWIAYEFVKQPEKIIKSPLKLLPLSCSIYGVFFTLLAYEAYSTPFLRRVTDSILKSMELL
ncbi:hypothetical protein DID78_00155 [Candidatus Marinamargulisbacteria bacterium SCGC AG-343-D04]|nr:hypothetical protein DID78_00155 [Candidatus Marinamargulisbacteria bacterium SCGC AG-343-D04]